MSVNSDSDSLGGVGASAGLRVSSPIVSVGDYAPSPNTCSQALTRANQLRVQALLRQLLVVQDPQRLDTLRVLRKTLRELDYHLSWLTQVDFMETLERVLREENESDVDWRLINDSTQLLIESIPRLAFDIDQQTVGQILISVVQNLGHQRSEVRRSSLLLLNMYINERPGHFQQVLKIFIDYGLANRRNQQAQRGAILSLPLLMTEQVVDGEDLLPLIKCLSELLVDADAQLFYSLYLALQRLHMTVGDQQFASYLRHCDPEAMLLYKQAASRNSSLADTTGGGSFEQQQPPLPQHSVRRPSKVEGAQAANETSEPKQVTFEDDSNFERHPRSQRQSLQQQTNGAVGGFDSDQQQQAGSEHSDLASIGSVNDDFPPQQQQQQQRLQGQRKQQQQQKMIDSSGSSADQSPTRRSTGGGGGAHAPFERQSSVSSTCSSEAKLVDPSHYMNAAALSGRPMSGYDEIHHVNHSSTGLAINDLGVCCTPTMELGPAAQNELKFGIFPRHLVNTSLGNVSSRYQDRIEALQKMMCIIRESPINHLAILMTYFDSFLEQFLGRLIGPGVDYKVELIGIDMIETIVIKTKISTIQYVRPMISLLMRTLGDSRAIFRDNTIRVIYKMMAFLPPQHVIDAIFEHKHSKSALVREESVNRVTAAVLEYDKNEFNLTKLCYHVLPMLADHHANVRLASLECIATLAHALGQERIGSLLTAAEAVQTGCDYDGLLDAINARLLRRALPRCNSDGSIRYVIKPFLNLANANHHQEHQAADVRWVLEAPSSHQHVGAHLQHHQASLADLSHFDHYHHHHHHHHPHRPGVYSPPDASQRRRSSVSLCQLASCNHELPEQHHHHHSVSTAAVASPQRQQQADSARRASGKRLSRADAAAASSLRGEPDSEISHATARQQAGDTVAEPTQRRASMAHAAALSDTDQEQQQSGGGNRSESQRIRAKRESSSLSTESARGGDESQQLAAMAPACASRYQGTEHDRPMAAALTTATRQRRGSGMRRSNSQDSTSSTDTNKVLFQYYLSKFKQSLTDTGNGTSMYSVGRVPGSVGPLSAKQQAAEQQKQQRQLDLEQAVGRRRKASHEASESSGSESPLTVMEAPPVSGSGRCQEQLHQQQQRATAVAAATAAERRGSVQAAPDRRASRHSSHEQQDQQQKQQEPVERRKQSVVDSTKASEVEQQSYEASTSRRQSAAKLQQHQSSGRQQQQSDNAASGRRNSIGRHSEQQEASAEGDSSRRQQQQRRSSSSRETAAEEKQEQLLAKRQTPQRRSLTRQSASVCAPDEADGSQVSSEGSAGAIVSQREEQQQQRSRSRQLSGGSRGGSAAAVADKDAISRRSLHSSGRQESVTTTDSQSSSQRECSDHTTQTSAHVGREGRRRRSRRRSSSSKRELAKGTATEVNDGRDEGTAGRQGTPTLPTTRNTEALEAGTQIEIRRRASQSQPPSKLRPQLSERIGGGTDAALDGASIVGTTAGILGGSSRRAVSVSPSVAGNVNIRHILENVAEVEGPFQEPQLAFKVAISALDGPCWSTKVEGLLALIRLATFHQQLVLAHLHEVVSRVLNETRNLRSTVARSAIFVLGDLCAKLKRSIEPELEGIVQALLHKSIENTAFIRDDIRRAFATMVDNLTQWRLANSLIHQGAQHKNMHVRRMASQFVALLVERMGPAKCLVGARDISAQLIPAAAKFAQDSSPQTRYYGRLILHRIMQHGAFERLLRKNLAPNLYRSTIGIIESVKRRGAGEAPSES